MARLIDSSVFVAMDRRGESLSALESALGGEPFAIASSTASELLFGVLRSALPDQQARWLEFVESVLSQIPVVAFDLEIARAHAQLTADLAGRGQSIGSNDLQIAATALVRGYSVLTHNVRHFERVPGLNISIAN
jgi:predicted nucleic acid-binding protein